MTHRQELVILIQRGTPPTDIYSHFSNVLGRSSVLDLFQRSGVYFPMPPSRDEITDERRRFLQELSLSD